MYDDLLKRFHFDSVRVARDVSIRIPGPVRIFRSGQPIAAPSQRDQTQERKGRRPTPVTSRAAPSRADWDALPELLTTREAAAILQCKPNTLEKWRIIGKGPRFVSLGDGKRSSVRYHKAEVRGWLRRHERASTSTPKVAA